MPNPTPELGLLQALDGDDAANYLDTSLANSLFVVDALFNNVSGHTHGAVHQGGPISAVPVSAIPDGSITSAKLTDGTIQTIDLGDGSITTQKLADGAVTTPKIASSITLTTPTLNSPTINTATETSPTISNPTISGTISGNPTFSNGPTTSDWFRVAPTGQGIFNTATGGGIGFDATGPFMYGAYVGGHLISETGTQTLSAKTLTAPQINNPAIASPAISDPTLSGTVSGQPTWASSQSFPRATKVGSLNALATHSSTDWIVDSGTIFFNAAPSGGAGTQIAANFNGAYTAVPYVVCQIRDTSGGTNSVQHTGVEARGVGTSGFFAAVDNQTGSAQSLWVDWIAFGH